MRPKSRSTQIHTAYNFTLNYIYLPCPPSEEPDMNSFRKQPPDHFTASSAWRRGSRNVSVDQSSRAKRLRKRNLYVIKGIRPRSRSCYARPSLLSLRPVSIVSMYEIGSQAPIREWTFAQIDYFAGLGFDIDAFGTNTRKVEG